MSTPKKPRILYHASRSGDIAVFEPRLGKRRDENEGAQVFATPSKAMATVFLVDTDDSWVQSGAMNEVPYIIISDKERFESLDQGGYIYALPSDSFETDVEKGLRELEYTSQQAVTPLDKEYVASALQAMIENGVAVYFVDQNTWDELQKSDDNGAETVAHLTPVTSESLSKQA